MMATKTEAIGACSEHGQFYMDAPDSPCPSCEDKSLSDIHCGACDRQLEYDENVTALESGYIARDDSDYVEEVGICGVLCEDCDTAVTRYIQELRKRKGQFVKDIDKLLDTIARHVDIPIEEE